MVYWDPKLHIPLISEQIMTKINFLNVLEKDPISIKDRIRADFLRNNQSKIFGIIT